MEESLTLKLKPNELDYLYNVLARQPWGEVNPLMMSIQAQVKEQQHAEPRNAGTS